MSRTTSRADTFLVVVRDLRTVFTLIPWRMRWRIIAMAIAAFLVAMLDLLAVASMLPLTQLLTDQGQVPPVIDRLIVPVVGTEDPQVLLLAAATAVLVAFTLKNLAVVAIRWWSLGQSTSASAAGQAEMLRLYSSARYADHRMRSKGAMLTMVTGAVPTAFNTVLNSIMMLIVDLVAVVMMFALLLAASPLAAVAAIVVFGGFSVLTARVLKPYSLKYAHRNFLLQKESVGYVNPAIEGFREMRIFQREELFVDRFRANRIESAGLVRFQLIFGELPKYLLEVVMILGILLVAVILFAAQPPSVAFGLLTVFAAAAMRIIPALNRMVSSSTQINAGAPVVRDLAEEIDTLRAQSPAPRSADAEPIRFQEGQGIEVRDLGFRYPDAPSDVISGVTVEIPFGSAVALVGGSGAGKTTFADVLAGLYEPTSGTIRAGGTDIVAHPDAWRREVAMVSQRVYLWDATIRELVTFGVPAEDVDEQLLAEVIRRARLHDVVAALPQGLDTTVGDEGSRLSGGQIQRLGIARALYSRPSVLILDEATSALDNQTEREITETIEALRGELTVIVIAHRLSTIRNSDEILFFADGRLRSRGSMSSLIRDDEDFAHLVSLAQLTPTDPPSAAQRSRG